jgi:hypothetical protein
MLQCAGGVAAVLGGAPLQKKYGEFIRSLLPDDFNLDILLFDISDFDKNSHYRLKK